VSYQFIQTFLSEVGPDLSAFPTEKHFVSWLCLCPNKKVTGGKVISSKTRNNKHPLRAAFKQAAIAVSRHKNSPLGHYYRKMAARKGKGTAIMATARKLAVIVYKMMKKGENYDASRLEPKLQAKSRNRKIKLIQRTIEQLKVDKDEIFFD